MTSTPDTTSVTTGTTSDTPDSLSLAEAAARLGVSERTILRRIEKGTIKGYKVDAERGQVWRVLLAGMTDTQDKEPSVVSVTTDNKPASMTDTPDSQAVAPQASRELMMTLDMLAEERRKVDQLQAELREASNTTAHWQARALTAEQTVQRLLPAPKDEPTDVTPQEAPTQVDPGPDWQAIAQALEERVKRLEEPPVKPEPPAAPVRVSWWRRLFE